LTSMKSTRSPAENGCDIAYTFTTCVGFAR
jgi:hypothetical protein